MAERSGSRQPRDGQGKDTRPPRRPAAQGRAAKAPGDPDVIGELSPDTKDDVDHIVAAWQRERPDLDVTPLHVLSRISRLARHLDRERRHSFARHELESFEFDVLSALRRVGEPYQLTPGQLLARTLVTSGTMTNRIDRLVTRGLVTREPDLADRRGVLVQLTDEGRVKVDAALADLVVTERRLLGVLTGPQADALGSLLRQLCLQYDSVPGVATSSVSGSAPDATA